MDEKVVEAEVWVRTKPRRIIHNQIVIQILAMIAMGLPIPLAGVVMYLIFGIVPSITIPLVIGAWFFALAFETYAWIVRKMDGLREKAVRAQ